MQLFLWQDFYKRENSTKRPNSAIAQRKDVVLKESTSIEHPTFIVSDVNWSWNYCQFNFHFYFIEDIVATSDHLFELVCKQDVLATYKNDISNYVTFVERSESSPNKFIRDMSISQVNNIVSATNKVTNLSNMDATGVYLVRTIGQTGLTGYMIGPSKYAELMGHLMNFGSYADFGDTVFKSFFNPFQYVVDVTWYPFNLKAIRDVTNDLHSAGPVYVGWWSLPNSTFPIVDVSHSYTVETVTLNLPDIKYDDFRRYDSNWTQFNLYLPGYGNMRLDSAQVKEGIKVTLTTDVLANKSIYVITDANSDVISTVAAQIGAPIQIGQLNATSVISGLAGMTASAVIGNIPGVISGTMAALNPTDNVNGVQGSTASIRAFPYIVLSQYAFGEADKPSTVLGYPCCKNIKLGDLTGYVQCGNPSIDIHGLANDKTEINNYLANGFYME